MKNQGKETTRFFPPKSMCIYFLEGKEELFVCSYSIRWASFTWKDATCHGVALELEGF